MLQNGRWGGLILPSSLGKNAAETVSLGITLGLFLEFLRRSWY